MDATREAVYRVINSERAYQDTQGPWAIGKVIPASSLSVGDEILLMEEYLQRARKAWADSTSPEIDALHIIRKVAGIAVRCMEFHGAFARR